MEQSNPQMEVQTLFLLIYRVKVKGNLGVQGAVLPSPSC